MIFTISKTQIHSILAVRHKSLSIFHVNIFHSRFCQLFYPRTTGEVLPKPTGMTIGRLGLDQFDGFFHGHLDEVSVYNSVINDDQVVRMFHEAVRRMNSIKPLEP